MGSRFGDSIVKKDINLWPFKVIEGSIEKPMIVVKHKYEEKKYSPEDISCIIPKNMKEVTEAFLGTKVIDSVITVPAYFNVRQRQATKDVGILAGLNVMRLISYLITAAITYARDRTGTKEKNVFIFDLGGGTFDVLLLNISKGGDTITVKAVGGDTHLGGEDFDMVIVNHCVQDLRKRNFVDVSENARAMGRLKVTSKKSKRDLSSVVQTSIEIDCLYQGFDFSLNISWDKFEELNTGFFMKCMEHVENCLRDGNMNKSDVDDVVIVGGSTRIPRIEKLNMTRDQRITEEPRALASGSAGVVKNNRGFTLTVLDFR
ncbi:putative heat shock protein 70 family, peptide-binding domain protein [Tanacetum coccineum]|uniref:Heat shock protein 70 family, peptide-binding domain protein n=1 Tax=Tanacetum coccineum TaxID=301880 RepID=A0ABQ5ETS8_9ASTR